MVCMTSFIRTIFICITLPDIAMMKDGSKGYQLLIFRNLKVKETCYKNCLKHVHSEIT